MVTAVAGVPEIVGALFPSTIEQPFPLPLALVLELQLEGLAFAMDVSAITPTRNATAAIPRAVIPIVLD